MKCGYYILSILFSTLFWCYGWTQNSPILKRHYPLDNKQGIEKVNRYDGTMQGTAQTYTDRFSNTMGAIKFADNSYISTPSFFSNFSYKTTGFTISFWLYIDEVLYKQFGKTPWRDSDPIVQAFYAKNDRTTLFGLHRRADRIVIDRYTTNTNNQTANWGVWLWDPINFTQRTGWYHVVLSCEPNRAFLHIFYPNGQIESCAYYFGIQDIATATAWGLGNNNGKSLILDDFKVYQGAATYEQVRRMHAQEAMPAGMYNVSIAADATKFIHPYSRNTTNSTPLELLEAAPDLHVYKWIFTPVNGKYNVYTIRMAYEDKYMHLPRNEATMSNSVELLDYDSQFARFYEWYLEPDGNGYYFIRSEADRSKYLHTERHAFDNGTRLEILDYNSGYAPLYKWKLNLIKTNYEIQKNEVIPDISYEIILSDNTFLGMMPSTPISGDTTSVRADRGSYPSLLSYWRFHKDRDDSYRIYSTVHPDYNLHPTSRNVAENTVIQAYNYNAEANKYYSYVLEKPNKYGRRFYLKQALNQLLCVTANTHTIGSPITLQPNRGNKTNQWAFYQSESPGANRQLYDLKPGIYRIVSVADQNKSITTNNYQWDITTDLVLKSHAGDRYTSHYWIVDYERDANGKPIMDGTYTIQLFGTDKLYFHTKEHALQNLAQLELYLLDREHIESEKWFIRPTRTGDGSYFIQNAGNFDLFVHLASNSIQDNAHIELFNYNSAFADTYSWKFQAVSILAPFDSGTQKVHTQKDQSKLLHVARHSTANAEQLEILTYSSQYNNSYTWNFIKNDDNTFFIQNAGSSYYMHPKGHSVENGTRLEQLQYDSQYAPYYKWIIVPGTRVGNTIIIRSVADPSMCVHLAAHSAAESTEVEILRYDANNADSFEWILK